MPSQSKLLGDLISAAGAVSVNGSNLVANTVANSAFQTGSVENYMSAQSLGFGMRNRIINGAMGIWQRGTSFSVTPASPVYTTDRWAFTNFAGAAATIQQVSSIGLSGFQYSTRVQRNSGQTGVLSFNLLQEVEFVNFQDLVGQTVTFSAWIRVGSNFSGSNVLIGTATGTALDQGTINFSSWTGQAYQVTAVSPTTSWQRFSYTLTIPSNAQTLAAYAQFSPTGTAGTNDYFEITGVQLEKGSTATSFDYRPYGTELQLCQRYYYRVKPNQGAVSAFLGVSGYTTSTTASTICTQFPVTMRTYPTALEQSGTASDYNVYSGGTTRGCSAVPTWADVTTNFVGVVGFTVASGQTAYQPAASRCSTDNAYLGWSAEL